MHEDHRERMRQRVLKSGDFTGFSDHELLEMLLYYTIPRSDTNPLAHRLFERFGDLRGICSAKPDELKSVPGIGDQSAVFLTMTAELVRRCAAENEKPGKYFTNIESIALYFCHRFACVNHECVYMMSLDNRMRMVDCRCVSEGTVNSAPLNLRVVAESAFWQRVGIVVLAHNHPNGLAVPSSDDLALTTTVQNALEILGVHLLEHLVIAGNSFCPILQTYQRTFRRSPLTGSADDNFYKRFYNVNHLEWRAPPIFESAEEHDK